MKGLVVGRIVHYVLSPDDAEKINRRRTTGMSIQARSASWPTGAQAHIGNDSQAGEVMPMVVTRIWTEAGVVNGQVFLDGNDTLWVQSIEFDPGDETETDARTPLWRHWHWPKEP